jgi:hypothetical protein
MDFKALMRPVRFGKGPPQDEVPAPLSRRQSGSRRLAALREAADVLKVLPAPGESLHAIMTGRYDLTDLLDVLLSRLGAATHLRIATLSFNTRNVQLLRAWTEAGQVERLTLLCSRFFVEHNPEIYEPLREALALPNRIAASRNHCKVVCFHFADGSKLAMEGSANLRTNSNTEQFALFHDAGLHDWFAGYIDTEVSKHAQIDQGDRPAAR